MLRSRTAEKSENDFHLFREAEKKKLFMDSDCASVVVNAWGFLGMFQNAVTRRPPSTTSQKQQFYKSSRL